MRHYSLRTAWGWLRPLTILLVWASFAQGEPYHPYPIVFVHGLNGGAHHWGVLVPCDYDPDGRRRGNDATRAKFSCAMANHMIGPFLNLMEPYFQPIQVGVARDTLTYLAAISLDDPAGSIDPGPYVSGDTMVYVKAKILPNGDTLKDTVRAILRDKGAAFELRNFIKRVLYTYYGYTWNLNPNARVVLVAHSMGGTVIAEALRQEPALKHHIHKVITLGAPLKGSYALTTFHRRVRIPLTLTLQPLFVFLGSIGNRVMFPNMKVISPDDAFWANVLSTFSACAGYLTCGDATACVMNLIHVLFPTFITNIPGVNLPPNAFVFYGLFYAFLQWGFMEDVVSAITGCALEADHDMTPGNPPVNRWEDPGIPWDHHLGYHS